MKKITILCMAAAMIVVFAGCGSGQKKDTDVQRAMQIQNEGAPKSTQGASTITPAYRFATKCGSCHGTKGEGKADFPKLAGQKPDVLAMKIKGYRDGTFGGERKALMLPQANALNADEIDRLAQFISTLK